MSVKVCTKCGESKPLPAFSKDASRPDGLRNQCRDCRRAADRNYRLANLERVREETRIRAAHFRAMDRERRAERPAQKPERKRQTPEERREYLRKWRAANPERIRAYRQRPYNTRNRNDFLSAWRRAHVTNPLTHQQQEETP